MTEPKHLPGTKRYCKREECGNEVTDTKLYCSRDCYPSQRGRQKKNAKGKLKACECPRRELFFDTTAGYQRMYFHPVDCRGRAKAKSNWVHMSKLADKSKDFRATVCVGRGVDGKGITKIECSNFMECSDSLCDGGDGKFLYEKNGNRDCYVKGKGVAQNTMGSSFAECHQN